ncbi:MAG TPA: SDR family NAD(P)-dependent oxidoreductase, partial [Puia sp.]
MQIIDRKRLSVVTGGASGIGLAITEKFITQGISTVVIGRDLKKLKDVESRFGSLCKTIAFDLNDLACIPALVEKIISKFGDIDILINNAGINQKKEFTE